MESSNDRIKTRSETESSENSEQTVGLRPRPELPSLFSAFARLTTTRLVDRMISQNYIPNTSALIQRNPLINYFNEDNHNWFKELVFKPWLSSLEHNPTLDGYQIYRPMNINWSTVVPTTSLVHIIPIMDSCHVTVIATHQQYLLAGLKSGVILQFDSLTMTYLRVYTVKLNHEILQIKTTKLNNQFYVLCDNEFVIFEYNHESAIYRYQHNNPLKYTLSQCLPILIVDSNGSVFIFSQLQTDVGNVITPIPGLTIESYESIVELKSKDLINNNSTRPLLIRNNCGIAIVNLEMPSNLTLWRKEMITLTSDEHIVLECFEDKLFYTINHKVLVMSPAQIYVIPLKNLGLGLEPFCIPTRGDPIKLMYSNDRELITANQRNFIEIFDAFTYVKKAVIEYRENISCVYSIRDMLLIGTTLGNIIVQTKYFERDQVCFLCLETFSKERYDVMKRCNEHVFCKPPKLNFN